MEASISSPRRGKSSWWQPAIIRLYKIAGIVALSAILVGLLAFVTVNVFYFFNRTWVRPVILNKDHAKALDAAKELDGIKNIALDLEAQRTAARAELAQAQRVADTEAKFIADIDPLVPKAGVKNVEGVTLRKQLDDATLARANAQDDEIRLTQRIKELDGRIDEERKILDGMAESPYVRAITSEVIVAFVPYSNRSNVTPGTALYSCSWGLIGCSRVGKVLRAIPGEMTDVHPHDNSFQRGFMVEVELTDRSAAEEKVLFAGKKPLWFL